MIAAFQLAHTRCSHCYCYCYRIITGVILECFLLLGERTVSPFLTVSSSPLVTGVLRIKRDLARKVEDFGSCLFISGIAHHYRLQFVPVPLHYDFMYLYPAHLSIFNLRARLPFAQYIILTRTSASFGFYSIFFPSKIAFCSPELGSHFPRSLFNPNCLIHHRRPARILVERPIPLLVSRASICSRV